MKGKAQESEEVKGYPEQWLQDMQSAVLKG